MFPKQSDSRPKEGVSILVGQQSKELLHDKCVEVKRNLIQLAVC
jgi:hypothetical protein